MKRKRVLVMGKRLNGKAKTGNSNYPAAEEMPVYTIACSEPAANVSERKPRKLIQF